MSSTERCHSIPLGGRIQPPTPTLEAVLENHCPCTSSLFAPSPRPFPSTLALSPRPLSIHLSSPYTTSHLQFPPFPFKLSSLLLPCFSPPPFPFPFSPCLSPSLRLPLPNLPPFPNAPRLRPGHIVRPLNECLSRRPITMRAFVYELICAKAASSAAGGGAPERPRPAPGFTRNFRSALKGRSGCRRRRECAAAFREIRGNRGRGGRGN